MDEVTETVEVTEVVDESGDDAARVAAQAAEAAKQAARVAEKAAADAARAQGRAEMFDNASSTFTGGVQSISEALTGDESLRDRRMSMLAYILFFIPMVTGDSTRSEFVKFHTNQGTVLFIAGVVFSIVLSIVQTILWGVVAAATFINTPLGILLGVLVGLLGVLGLVPVGLAIIGIINAANGEMKKLPFIGDITIVK
jgi:uncharacterized membrane protein